MKIITEQVVPRSWAIWFTSPPLTAAFACAPGDFEIASWVRTALMSQEGSSLHHYAHYKLEGNSGIYPWVVSSVYSVAAYQHGSLRTPFIRAS